jgi:hypothetical protein
LDRKGGLDWYDYESRHYDTKKNLEDTQSKINKKIEDEK